LTFAGTTTINASTLNTDINVTWQGVVSESVAGSGWTKAGTGTAILNSANTYTGQTTIAAGTVRLGNNAALGSEVDTGKTVIHSGGSLDVFGYRAGASGNELIEVQGTGDDGLGALLSTRNYAGQAQ